MKIGFRKDPGANEPYVLVCASARTPEVEQLLLHLREPQTLAAYDERGEVILKQSELLRIYTQQRKVKVDSTRGTFSLRERIYELETLLDSHEFVRISNSEIVNRRKILGLDFSLTGTIRLSLEDGIETYVSRRYVARIRQMFES